MTIKPYFENDIRPHDEPNIHLEPNERRWMHIELTKMFLLKIYVEYRDYTETPVRLRVSARTSHAVQ